MLLQSLERVLLETCKPKEAGSWDKPVHIYWGQIVPACCCTMKANRILGNSRGISWGHWSSHSGLVRPYPAVSSSGPQNSTEMQGEWRVPKGMMRTSSVRKDRRGLVFSPCRREGSHFTSTQGGRWLSWHMDGATWRGQGQLVQGFPTKKKMDQMISQGFFQPGLVYDPVVLYWKFIRAYELGWKVMVCTLWPSLQSWHL